MCLDMLWAGARFVARRRLTCTVRWCSGGKDDWWGKSDGGSSVFDDLPADEDVKPSSKAKEPPARKSSLFTAAPVRREPVITGTPKLSLDEALYLAKEAGIFTTREVQTHIIKSPSFSDNDSPFLLENFFESADETGGDPYAADFTAQTNSGSKAASADPKTAEEKAAVEKSDEIDVVPQSVHEALLSLSLNPVRTFGARGREWKVTASGKGTRKRSTAHVVIERGTGVVKVNGEEDFYKRFPLLSNRFDVLFPFQACGAAGLFDVYISVKGGGISGQAGAARLAVGRALVSACSACEEDLKDSLVLYEDTRQKTSKFPGKKGAYARKNWTRR